MRLGTFALALCLAALPVFSKAGEPSLDDVLAKMDRAAGSFKGMTANLDETKYTKVIDDKSVSSGVFHLSKNGREFKILIDFQKPDPKAVSFAGKTAQIYYPAMKTVQVYDLGKQSNMVEQFLMLGFGSTGKELTGNYAVKLVGTETVAHHNTYHLSLIPKSPQVKEQFARFELWMDEDGTHPVQQQVFQSSGDYYLFTYYDAKVNPAMTDAEVTLKLPKGVKREVQR